MPTLTLKRNMMPTFYRDNTSQCDDMLQQNENSVSLKLYNNHDWYYPDKR